MVSGIGPWQRIILVTGSAMCLCYSVARYLDGDAFFMQAVVGFAGIIFAMSPPQPGMLRWPTWPTFTKTHKQIVSLSVALTLLGSASYVAWQIHGNRERLDKEERENVQRAEDRRKAQVVVHCPSAPPALPDWQKDQEQRARVQKRFDPAKGGNAYDAYFAREHERDLLFIIETAQTRRDMAIAIRTIRGMGELDPTDDRTVLERTWSLCQNGYKHLLEGPPLD